MEPHSLQLTLNLSPPSPWLLQQHNIIIPDNSTDMRDFLARLESEIAKIEYFQPELPLSLLLLTDAVGRLREEVGRNERERVRMTCDLNESPMTGSEASVSLDGDKKTWMRSAQLWCSDQTSFLQLQTKKKAERTEEKAEGSDISPLRKDVDMNKQAFSSLALSLKVATSEPVQALKIKGGGDHVSGRNTFVPILPDQFHPRYQTPSPASESDGKKKHRRCWSPELHRRFIAALDMLGGSHVATPKQVKDQMQVTGLTNDEVKSHLQKYRLHIKRLPNLKANTAMAKMFSYHDIIHMEANGNGGDGVRGQSALKEVQASHSGSSQGSLPMAGATKSVKCNSTAGSRCPSIERVDEAKSDSPTWGGV